VLSDNQTGIKPAVPVHSKTGQFQTDMPDHHHLILSPVGSPFPSRDPADKYLIVFPVPLWPYCPVLNQQKSAQPDRQVRLPENPVPAQM